MMIARVRKFCRRHRWILVLLILLAVVVPGFIRTEQLDDRQDNYIECVAEWADQTTARSEYLAAPIARKDVAEDNLIRAVALDDPEEFRVALTEYLEASDALAEARAEQPVPESPRLQCDGG